MIVIEHNPEQGVFRAMEEGREVGNLEYEISSGLMVITHTRAYLQGRGLGRMLASAAIGYARQHGMKVVPRCSFVKALMEIVDEYRPMMVVE